LNTPANEASTAATFRNPTDLLGLLRSAQSNQSAHQTPPVPAQSRPISAADLVAGFGRRPSSIGSITSPTLVAPSASRPDLRAEAASTSSTNSQDFLLRLLNSQTKTETFSPPKSTDFTSKPIATSEASISTSSIQTAAPAQPPVATLVENTALIEKSSAGNKDTAQDFGYSQHLSSTIGAQESQPPTSNPSYRSTGPLFTYSNPFEQLSTSSPVNKQTVPPATTPPVTAKPATPKLQYDLVKNVITTATPPQITPQESPDISSRTPQAHETVSEAVAEVGEQAEKQVEEVLAKLDLGFPRKTGPKLASRPKSKRAPISDEMDESSDNALVYDSWEAAAAAAEGADRVALKIFNLPMKPFTSIDILHLEDPPASIPADSLLHCVRSRKEFDQVDRNLVAFTSRYILYAMKDKGFRVIDQDTAKWKLLFPQSDERIFNITLSLSRSANGSSNDQASAALATGVKGTVFWVPFTRFEAAPSRDDRGFILPPIESGEEHTSNSQLKTRVKASARHPEFFAYGRGKFIHIIRPFHAVKDGYTDKRTEILNTQKYLTEDNLKICTGKAAKDFTFSSDDTVIASLDKAGKLKFWDIQPLTERALDKASVNHEVKTPIMSLNTCSKSEKAWPTSVMFIDKEKPMNNGLALRYMFIGMKQNHSLQLWDLGLGQQVQEINFPHDDESDAICSLAFNTKNGVLVVGHPTRNSIYLLHVSPPKYTVQPMSQAKYMTMLSTKDKNLPSLSSTAIVSSIREYTLNNIGVLRSLDLMMDSPSSEDGTAPEKDYVMTLISYHSKGIFEFTLMREHLGWSKEGKPLNTTEADDGEQIKSRPLVQPSQDDAGSTNGDSISANGTATKTDDAAKSSTEAQSASQASPEKKRDKKKKGNDAATSTPKAPKAGTTPDGAGMPRRASNHAVGEINVASRALTDPSFTPSTDSNLSTMEKRIISSFERVISERLTLLQNRIEDDRRASEAAAAAKEDTIMRHITQTLPQSVEKNLKSIVTKSLSESLDTMKESVTNTLDRSVTTAFANAIKHALPREIEKMAPAITNKLSQDHNLVRSLSAGVSKEVTSVVTREVQRVIQEVVPAIELAAIKSTTQSIAGLEQRIMSQLQSYETRRQADATKIDSLNAHVNNLNAALRELVEQQARFKADVMAQFQVQSQKPAAVVPEVTPAPVVPEKSVKQESEITSIQGLMSQGRSEEAFVQVSLLVCYMNEQSLISPSSGFIQELVKEKSSTKLLLTTIPLHCRTALLLLSSLLLRQHR
jgi:hypothetical protein